MKRSLTCPHHPSVRRIRLVAARGLCLVMLLLPATWMGPSPVSAEYLGGGRFAVTASVFGGPGDGLVGNETSSGRTLLPFDRLVALPACTESSCPWVDTGTGPEGTWGPQTSCAESDGLCWVEVTSDETGACAAAPVFDLGPLFVEDNWWSSRRNRTYDIRRGIPAAERARDGADLGFGEGISDVGYDIQNVYNYAAAIDLAEGTWVDLGFDVDQGVTDVSVRMLWQAGISHEDACDGRAGSASTVDDVNLRSGPSTDDEIITVVPSSSRLSLAGAPRNGFVRVDYDGMRGWIFADYVAPDGGGAGDATAFVVSDVNLRGGPSTDDDIILEGHAGNNVVVTGPAENGFRPVVYRGTEGWMSADYLDLGGNQFGGSAATLGRLNLRSGPSTSSRVLQVMPSGARVTLTGDADNGFASVRYDGVDGWASTRYLDLGDSSCTVLERLNLRSGPSTADDVIEIMLEGAIVTLTGEEENGFVSVRYGDSEGWAYASYLG